MNRAFILCAAFLLFPSVASGQKVRCESVDGEYRECYVASSGKIVLDYELSSLLCVQGVSWGTAAEGRVWVQRGCRAMFSAVTETEPFSPADHIVCESMNGGRSTCSARPFSRITLLKQLSSRPCDEGGSWGYDPERGEIWVDQGCKGEFVVGAGGEGAKKQEPLDAVVVCRSLDGKKAKCPADTSAGVQFFRSLSEGRCRFGREWGYDRKQIWVKDGCSAEFAVRGRTRPTIETVSCESPDGSPAKCPADTKYGVALIREAGADPCVAGETWGFDDDGVWVAKRCVALFALGGYRLSPDAVPQTAARVTCESKQGETSRCEVETKRGVGLIADRGDALCVLNRTWGYDDRGIWVRDGCSAEFAVAR